MEKVEGSMNSLARARLSLATAWQWATAIAGLNLRGPDLEGHLPNPPTPFLSHIHS